MSDFFEWWTFLAYLVVGSAYCFGVYKLFDDILLPVKAYFESYYPMWICKPLFSCPPCLASVHGSYLGLLFFGISWKILLFCFCLCGLNYIINSLLPNDSLDPE